MTGEQMLITAVSALVCVVVYQERTKMKLTEKLLDLTTRTIETNVALKGAMDVLRESLRQ